MVTDQSVREGAALICEFRRGSAVALARRIESTELITREEVIERLGGNRRWVTSAFKGERLFAVEAPAFNRGRERAVPHKSKGLFA